MTKKYTTKICKEQSANANSFSADSMSTYGFDIVTEILPQASFIEYLFLMIKGKRPNQKQRILLEKLALLLMNPGIRDTSIRTAMNAGIGDAPPPAVLISALCGGSGQCSGSREIRLIMNWLSIAAQTPDIVDINTIKQQVIEKNSIWPKLEHMPGFTQFESSTSKYVRDCLEFFSQLDHQNHLLWLFKNLEKLESEVKNGLSLNAVIGAAFCDLDFTHDQAEYLFLILRLPAASAYAIEQKALGWKHFPFFTDTVEYKKTGRESSPPDVDDLIKGYLHD